jgi:deoxyribonuclease-1-like protein
MLQIQKRWPILTAVAAAIAYSANHYRIDGLEHLRIEQRSMATSDRRSEGDGSLLFGPSDGAPPWGGGADPGSPPWNSSLTLGEKMALMQGGQQPGKGRSLADAGLGWSAPTPIPVPVGIPSSPSLPAAGQPWGGGRGSDLTNIAIPGSLLDGVQVGRTAGLSQRELSPASVSGQRVRIASFNAAGLGPTKLAKPHVMETLVRMLRQYDVVALQGIQSSRDDILPILTERLNQSGRSYDYLIGPRVGNGELREQFAFLFDTGRVETDRYQLYTIEDPDNLVTFDPLVAWFRCKEPPPQRAFTFSIVNVHLLTTQWNDERELLPSIIQAVEHDGRREDDWIIAGTLHGGAQGVALDVRSVRPAFTDIPTDVVGEHARSAILFSAPGTVEFTGRSGAFDFLRKYNLSLERSLEVSEHLPIWAEFSAIEGGEPGRIAPADNPTQVF